MDRSLFRATALAILLMAVCACTHKSEEDRFVEDLLSRMTLEEKIGQMNQLDPEWDADIKEPLIRRFGEAWYNELELTATEWKKQCAQK